MTRRPQPRRVLLLSHLAANLAGFRRPLIRELVARGIEVVAAVPDSGPAQDIETLTELGARVRTYPLRRGSMNPLGLVASAKHVSRIIEETKPDLVHSFTHQPNILARLALPKGYRLLNSVTGLGSCFLGGGLKGTLLRTVFTLLYRTTAGKPACIVFQNDDDRAYFESRAMTGKARLAMVRGSGVDTARFRPGLLSPEERIALRTELGLPETAVVATMAARLIRDKGVHEFLAAARLLQAEQPQAVFLLVGDADPGNPTSLTSEETARARAEGAVVFAGHRSDMERIFAASDVAVLPSYREGLPVSLQEAMACGLPVVATDVPGCRDLARTCSLPPEDGEAADVHCLLAPARDAEALAEVLAPLLADAELRASMGAAARAKALADFDGAVLAKRMLQVYENVLSEPAR